VAAVEVLRIKEETQFTTKIDGFWSFTTPPPFNLTLCMTKLRFLVLCFHYFTDNSINSFAFHPQLCHTGHPMHGLLVDAGSLWPSHGASFIHIALVLFFF
jgi:hypothetical protein